MEPCAVPVFDDAPRPVDPWYAEGGRQARINRESPRGRLEPDEALDAFEALGIRRWVDHD
jgi:hypothetical protein